MLSSDNKTNSLIVKGAKEQLDQWCNLLDRIIKDNQLQVENQTNNTFNNNVDEIRKYKNLLDDGIITQEEFDKKKTQLLNL